jgi:uncharacterized membrane protein
MTEPSSEQTLRCPRCRRDNVADAVFCSTAGCGKALGEFAFELEESARTSSWLERMADKVARIAGHPHFVSTHVLWFALWILANSGMIAGLAAFDAYPYGLLGIVLAIEAALVTGFLLVSNNRQNARAETRATLEYEVNVRSYRLARRIEAQLAALDARLDRLERSLHNR